MIADNFDEFCKKVVNAEVVALNSEKGQKFTEQLLISAVTQNTKLTSDEWESIKQNFLVFCFAILMKDNKALMSELQEHVFNETYKKG